MQTTIFTGEVHPAADVFPMLADDELDALATSIAEHGLAEPIWLTPDGVLLDGRNRLAACAKAGVEPTFRVYDGDDLVDFIVRLNIHRRHLSTGQKAMAATDLLPMYEAEAKARKAHGATAPGKTLGADRHQASERAPRAAKLAAKAVGTSGRAVGRAKRVTEQAPDLAEKVREGTLALDAAERQLKRRKTQQEEQAARNIALADVPADADGPGWRLLAGDFRDRLNDLPDGSVDLIVTDPPYPAEFLHLWEDLSKHASRVLAPQGLLVAMVGKIQLPQVMQRLDSNLTYKWLYCQPNPGASLRILATHVLEKWKPWLCYGNGNFPVNDVDWHEDMVTASTRSKDAYRWQQDDAPAAYLIDVLCPPGGMVLDPFMGTGSYGVAAVGLGRQFVGCEIDTNRFAGCAERLAAS